MNSKASKHFATGVLQNVVANWLAPLIPLVLGAVIVFGVTNPVPVLLLLLILMVLPSFVLTVRYLWMQRSDARFERRVKVVLDEQDNAYFFDHYGRIRAIPDLDTFYYFVELLGTYKPEELQRVSSDEILRRRSERIIGVDQWKHERPRTPEEEEARSLRRTAHQVIKVTWTYEAKENDPKMVFSVENRYDKPIIIRAVRLQPHSLATHEIQDKYQHIDSYIYLSNQQSSLQQGRTGKYELSLMRMWDSEALDRLRGKLGHLVLDLIFEQKDVQDIIYPM